MVQYMDNKNSGFNMWNANRAATAPKKSPFSGFLWWTLVFIAAWWMVGVFMSPKQTTQTTDTATAIVDLSAVPVSNISSDNLKKIKEAVNFFLNYL